MVINKILNKFKGKDKLFYTKADSENNNVKNKIIFLDKQNPLGQVIVVELPKKVEELFGITTEDFTKRLNNILRESQEKEDKKILKLNN